MPLPEISGRPLLVGGEKLAEKIVLTRGGRPPVPPRTLAEARGLLRPQVADVAAKAAQISRELRASRLYVEATLLPNYLANSHHPAALFAEAGFVPVGSRASRGKKTTAKTVVEDAPAKTYLLAGEDGALEALAGLLRDTSAVSTGIAGDIAKIDQFRLPAADELLRFGTGEVQMVGSMVAFEAVLHPTVNSFGQTDEVDLRRVLAKFAAHVKSLGGRAKLERRREEHGLVFIPVVAPAGAAQDLARFNPLRTLRPMPKLAELPLPAEDSPFRGAATSQTVRAPGFEASTNERIAVFDGGVDPGAVALVPYVRNVDLTGGTDLVEYAVAHGTTVVSAALYGSLADATPQDAPPACVDAFRIWPPPASEEADTHLYWVLEQIENEVATGRHRIVNLSLGPGLNIEDDHEPHAWTLALDRLAKEHDVLFVVAAGNTGMDDQEAGLNRICVPADIVNGISVGSCEATDEGGFSRSPYSSIGPGRAGAKVAPTGVAHGGSVDESQPFRVVAPGGVLASTYGTSFAAPSVARGIADLREKLGPRSSPHLLRAFACHFADRTDTGLEHELGWGRLPVSYRAHLGSNANEATVLYEAELRRGQSMMLRLPLPADVLAGAGGRSVSLRYTLAFTTNVDGTDAVDYGQSGIDLYFRPHSQTFNLNRGEASKRVNRLKDQAQFDELVREGWTPSDRPCTRSRKGFAPESERRQDGKWETIVRADDRLRATTLHDPAFDLHFLAREGGGLTSASEEIALPYVLVVTVTAPLDIPLYDRITSHYPALSPLMMPAQVDLPTTVPA
jgi:hypothetical protein